MYKKFILKTVILFYTIFINISYSEIVYYTGVEHYYRPEGINSLSNRIFAFEDLFKGIKSRPYNRLTFTHGGLGPQFSKPTLWNIQDYTGIYPKQDYDFQYKQIGSSSACCASAFQVEAGSGIDTGQFGWAMNTANVPLDPNPNYHMVNMQASYAPIPQTLKPWKLSEDSKFAVEFSIKVPYSHVEYGAASYVTAGLAIRDGSGHFFWVQPVIHLNGFSAGAEYIDGIGHDGGTDAYYINPIYKNSGRYMSIFDNPYTGQRGNITSSSTWSEWRWYSFYISKTHLKNMINDLNLYEKKFSSNYEDYSIEFISIQSEMTRTAPFQIYPPGGYMSVGVKQLYVYRIY